MDIPATKVELENGINAGLLQNIFGEIPGLVPIFEEHYCRMESDISLETWAKMERYEKAFIIAFCRVKTAVKNLQTEAEINESKKKARKR